MCSHRLFTVRSLVILLIGGFFSSLSLGAQLYVNASSGSDSNSGTQAAPFKTIKKGLQVVTPGSTLFLSGNFNEWALGQISGTQSAPITIDAYGPTSITNTIQQGQAGALQLQDVDYYIVKNLTFDGHSQNTSQFGLWLRAVNRSNQGHQVLGCTFKNWGSGGNTAALIASGTLDATKKQLNPLISLCTFISNRCKNISLSSTDNAAIDSNDFGGTLYGINEDNAAVALGIFVQNYSVGMKATRNNFHDWGPFFVGTGNYQMWAGIWSDVAATNGLIESNKIWNILSGRTDGNGIGIFTESRCSGWTIRGNEIYQVGVGVRNGDDNLGDPHHNTYDSNFIHNVGRSCGEMNQGTALKLLNNQLQNYPNAGWNFGPTIINQGPFTIQGNTYGNTAKVANWNGSIKSLSQWQAMGYDTVTGQTPSPPILQPPIIVSNQPPIVITPSGGYVPGNLPTPSNQPSPQSSDGGIIGLSIAAITGLLLLVVGD